MRLSKNGLKLSVISALGMAALSSASYGIIITPTFGSSITSDSNAISIEAGINQAISFFQSRITTGINVTIDFESVSDGLGTSATAGASVTYNQYLSALQSHASSTNDATALATLAAGPNNPVNGTTGVRASLPLLHALGFNISNNPGAPDSTISLNTGIMNFTRTSIDPDKYDLTSVVEHEMDEVLGIGSRLDSGVTDGDVSGEDLFRYSAPGVRSFSTSSSAKSYFSIDGGVTNIAGFNQVGPPGESDYGDWDSTINRTQNAFGTPGTFVDPSTPELTALDVLGYSLAVPEPASVALMGLGGLMLLRRRRA